MHKKWRLLPKVKVADFTNKGYIFLTGHHFPLEAKSAIFHDKIFILGGNSASLLVTN